MKEISVKPNSPPQPPSLVREGGEIIFSDNVSLPDKGGVGSPAVALAKAGGGFRILITGARGMLAGYLIAELKENYQLILADREECDLLDFDLTEKFILKNKPDIIINCSGYNAVDLAENEGQELAFKLNGEAVGNLARIAKEIGVAFITYSSEYVFDGEKKEGYLESDQVNPISKYGASKVLGEKLVQEIGGKYYIIRTSRLFGKKGESGESKENIIDKMLKLSTEKSVLEVVDAEKSSPTYALDLSRQTRLLLEGDYLPGIYHITNSGACAWYELIKYVFAIKDVNIKLIPISADKFSRPAKRPAFGELVNTKLPRLRDWKEAVEEYLL